MWNGCYGSKEIRTPNTDKLAAGGVFFEHHYVQMTVCTPARAALLTSLCSERTRQVYGPTKWDTVKGVVDECLGRGC